NGRWYLYVAHLWHRGWSVLDVTEPTAPELCVFIPGPENTWTIQIQVADGTMITALERIAPGWGGAEGKPFSEGFLIFDISLPTQPKQVGHFRTGSSGTHRNFYDGGNLVHAAAGAPDMNGKIYRIIDIADPSNPREVGRFSLPEQQSIGAADGRKYSCHGPPHLEGSRAYVSYGDGGAIILDIADFSRPKLISQLAFRGITASQGIHTYLPLPGRNIALINDEAIGKTAMRISTWPALSISPTNGCRGCFHCFHFPSRRRRRHSKIFTRKAAASGRTTSTIRTIRRVSRIATTSRISPISMLACGYTTSATHASRRSLATLFPPIPR
ncbi:MAG TPA: hypothetical protein VFV82_12495, partial [Candidatus Binatia bacterium]|nr:hypothetical protein [Candidatus Binatia bacterium]